MHSTAYFPNHPIAGEVFHVEPAVDATPLLVGAGTVTLLLAVGLFAVLPRQLDSIGREAMEEQALALVNLVADMSGVSIRMAQTLEDPSYVKESLATVKSMDQVRAVTIYAHTGRPLASHPEDSKVVIPSDMPTSGNDDGLRWDASSLIAWKRVRDGKGEAMGVVALDVSVDRLEAIRAQNLRTATLLTISMGGGLLVGLLLLGTRLTGPVLRLTQVADQVSAGRLENIEPPTEQASESSNEPIGSPVPSSRCLLVCRSRSERCRNKLPRRTASEQKPSTHESKRSSGGMRLRRPVERRSPAA